MSQFSFVKKKRNKATPFHIERTEINKAVEEYLKNGGKITKLVADDESYIDFINKRDAFVTADDFLLDN